jgi:hypothetical protein
MLHQLPNFQFLDRLKGVSAGSLIKVNRANEAVRREREEEGRWPPGHQGRAKTHQRGSDFGGGDAHRVFTAAQNCSVTAVVSSVTFQPFVWAFSLANFCSF